MINMHLCFFKNSFVNKNFIYLLAGPERLGSADAVPTARENPEQEAKARVNEALSTDINAIMANAEKLSASQRSPFLDDAQINDLKNRGFVTDIKVEKSPGGHESTALYFDTKSVQVMANGQVYNGNRAFITHHDTERVVVSTHEGKTTIRIINKDGTMDRLTLEPKPESRQESRQESPEDRQARNVINDLASRHNGKVLVGAMLEDGTVVAVLEKSDRPSYKDAFTVFVGRPGSMRQLAVSEAERLRNGGTTTIKAGGHTIYAPAYNPQGITFDDKPLRSIM
jgi:hypothetical protein